MSYHCEIKDQPAQPILSIRTRTPMKDLPQAIAAGYGAVLQYLGELGEQPIGPPFAAYYNMDMDDLDVELGFPVAKRLPGRAEVKAGELPAGRVATCIHRGPYSALRPAYEALAQFVREKGYEATGVAYEIYYNDPGQTPPSDLMTQIVFPLKKA